MQHLAPCLGRDVLSRTFIRTNALRIAVGTRRRDIVHRDLATAALEVGVRARLARRHADLILRATSIRVTRTTLQ